MLFPSFVSDSSGNNGERDDLSRSFVKRTPNINDISYNKLFQEYKGVFFASTAYKDDLVYKLIKKPSKTNPFINQYKLVKLPGRNTTTISDCTNSNAKIKLAVSPMNNFVAIKQFKKGNNCNMNTQTASSNTVSLKILNSYMENGGLEGRITPDQAHMRVQFDKLAWEYYVYLKIKEARDEKGLKTDNIVDFYGVIDSRESSKVWFVFEYCELGETVWEEGLFEDFLNKLWNKCYGFSSTPFFFANFVSIKFLRDCLKGLNFLNQIGITHRDIKPSNILVQRNLHKGFTFKISDFETAIVSVDEDFPDIENLSKSELYKKYQNEVNRLIGSPMFIAPEICSFVIPDVQENSLKKELKIENLCNITLLDPMKIDCWALGVSLYCLLSGNKPFRMQTGGSEFDLYRRINSEDIMEVFRNPKESSTVYDISALRPELATVVSSDIETKKVVELANFTLLEICDQLLVKENSKRKRASEILTSYGSYLTFIEDTLMQLVNRTATNGDLKLPSDSIVNLVKKSPFRIKSNSSFMSNSSHSNSGDSLHITVSSANSVQQAGNKFKKLFQRNASRGSKSPSSRSLEKLEISAPIAPQYLSLDSDTSPESSYNRSLFGSPLNAGKYIDLTSFSNRDDGEVVNSSSNEHFGLGHTDNDLLSITSSDSSLSLSGSDYTEYYKNENPDHQTGNFTASSEKMPTPYTYSKLNFDCSQSETPSGNIRLPKRSPMRQISVGKSAEPDTQPGGMNKRTLTPSMKTMDFKKYLKEPEDEPKKTSRLTLLNIRDSILNFENVDSLKRYLNFAEQGEL